MVSHQAFSGIHFELVLANENSQFHRVWRNRLFEINLFKQVTESSMMVASKDISRTEPISTNKDWNDQTDISIFRHLGASEPLKKTFQNLHSNYKSPPNYSVVYSCFQLPLPVNKILEFFKYYRNVPVVNTNAIKYAASTLITFVSNVAVVQWVAVNIDVSYYVIVGSAADVSKVVSILGPTWILLRESYIESFRCGKIIRRFWRALLSLPKFCDLSSNSVRHEAPCMW